MRVGLPQIGYVSTVLTNTILAGYLEWAPKLVSFLIGYRPPSGECAYDLLGLHVLGFQSRLRNQCRLMSNLGRPWL